MVRRRNAGAAVIIAALQIKDRKIEDVHTENVDFHLEVTRLA